MNSLSLVRKNLFRKKLRAWLMILSIFVAFFVFGILMAFKSAILSGRNAPGDRLVVVNKVNFTIPLPLSYFNRVSTVPGVKYATHIDWFGGYYKDPRNLVTTFAVEPASYLQIYRQDFDFTPEATDAFISNRAGALVGETALRKLGLKVGDHVPISSNIYSQANNSHTWDMTIVGTFKGLRQQVDSNFILFQYEYFNGTRSFSKNRIGWIALTTEAATANDQVEKAIDGMFVNSPDETTTDTEMAFNQAFVSQFGDIALIITLIVGAALTTVLMIVGNTMMLAVRERTRELAVLKTIGFPTRQLVTFIVAESVLLAFIGGIPGIALAAFVARGIKDNLEGFMTRFVVTPGIAFSALALMISLGLVAALIPGLHATRLRIAVALGRS
jgi:putative ABC transport system permease protein